MKGEHLALYLEQEGEILDVSSDQKYGKWRLGIMSGKQAFTCSQLSGCCWSEYDDHRYGLKTDILEVWPDWSYLEKKSSGFSDSVD